MPSSNPESIPVIINLLWTLSPQSVLDIGTGLGKYGVLFREYLELRHRLKFPKQQSDDFTLYKKRLARIDGVEGYSDYIGELHKIIYDNIYNKDILQFLKEDWQYDLIFSGDVIEHIDKSTAMKNILPKLVERAKMGVLISVPSNFAEQDTTFGNTLEEHRSSWVPGDFRSLAPFVRTGYKGSHLISFMTKDENIYRMIKGNAVKRKLRIFKRFIKDSW